MLSSHPRDGNLRSCFPTGTGLELSIGSLNFILEHLGQSSTNIPFLDPSRPYLAITWYQHMLIINDVLESWDLPLVGRQDMRSDARHML
jgi:hypothetical protein